MDYQQLEDEPAGQGAAIPGKAICGDLGRWADTCLADRSAASITTVRGRGITIYVSTAFSKDNCDMFKRRNPPAFIG